MIKRSFDIVISFTILVVCIPIFLVAAVVILLSLGRPVFFLQERPGLNERIFKLVKFRTMKKESDANGEMLPDEKRLTRVGRLLRATSIDELPALFNVLRGDMSLVGPRPLLVEYLSRYTDEQAKRHRVLPGITGWAQVNGRNSISWEQKFKYDVWYVENRSFWLDLKILFLTIKKVVIREGISAEGEATMFEFKGTKNGK